MFVEKIWLFVLAISFFNLGYFVRGIINQIEKAMNDS